MKKIFIILAIVIIVVCIIGVKYYSYIADYNIITNENKEYEQYKDKEIYGLDLATIINKAVDRNIKNKIKNEDGIFIPNNEDSIKIDVYMKDNETTYKMEVFYNNGIEHFMFNYRDIKFKCAKIDYHKSTGKIKYMLFEQL